VAQAKKTATGKNGGTLNRSGRPKGVPNKLNGDIRQMVRKAMALAETQMRNDELKAAGEPVPREQADPVDYLKRQAINNPTPFLGLIKGLMPKQIDIELSLTGEDLTATLQARRDALAARETAAAKPIVEEAIVVAEALPAPDKPKARRRRRKTETD
jgi:hypothetical protein